MLGADFEWIRAASAAQVEAVAALTQRICAVPSPTGHEGERAHFLADLWRERGYTPEIDDVSNIYIRRAGRDSAKVVLLLSHIDTVFPPGTPITVRREGNTLYGPGIGDNSMNVAAVIALFDILDAYGIETATDLIAVGDVGEEGLGNLRGARRAVERYRDTIGAVLVIDGRGGEVTHGAVGSKRWRVTVNGKGGHSYQHFGIPSAIHGLGRIIAGIAALDVPTDPKTTYNVGIIEGGTSVNTIAPSASAIIDLRSTDIAALNYLALQVQEIIATAPGDGLTTEIEILGERPAGSRPLDDPLVRLAADSLLWLGITPTFGTSSTDANIPISLGIPSVCVGVSDGANGHTVNESVQIAPVAVGLAHIARLTLEASVLVAGDAPRD